MPGWLSGLAQLGGDLASRQARRIGIAVALWGLVAILLLVALGFATAGIYAAIRTGLGPIPSLFIMAALFVTLALIFVIFATRQGKRSPTGRPVADIPELKLDGEAARLASLGTLAAAFAFGVVRGLMRRRR